MGDRATLRFDEVRQAGLDDWRMLFSSLHARFCTGDFATGLRLVDAIGAAAEELGHHPELQLRYPAVDVQLISHDVGGITDRDLTLARRISELAAAQGVPADPAAVGTLEIALDTADHARIAPFWAALLGLAATERGDELVDPIGRLPTMWFQRTDPHDPPRQRFHLDIRVPPEQAEARIDAAIAAGGTLVTAEYAPAFTVLADPDGNRVCVCTGLGRD